LLILQHIMANQPVTLWYYWNRYWARFRNIRDLFTKIDSA